MKSSTCEHLENFDYIAPPVHECQECVKTGDRWVHLRTCQECGITLCCDSSPNKHASKHAKHYGHSVAVSAEPGESWAWCYEHQILKMLD